jgi:hypothetical protein
MLVLKELKESYQLSFVGKKESSANVIGFFMNNIHNEFEKIIESEMMKTNDVFYNLYRKACIKAFKNIVKICKDMELGFGQSNELPNRIEVKINKNIELMRLRI